MSEKKLNTNLYAVKMEKINKSFGDVKVLHDVNLALREGEVLGLVGKNGAGKSTLVKILYGVETPDCGSIEIFDKKLNHSETSSIQRQNIGMIFQEFSLIPTLTVAENIFLYNLPQNKFYFLDIQRCRKMATSILNFINACINPDEVISNLSVVEKQSVEIAKALSELSKSRKILIMDEPTSAFSSDQVETLFKVIKNLKKQGVSIIYISHNLRQVFKICDRISVIRNGRNVLTCAARDTNFGNVVYSMTGIETKTNKDYLQKDYLQKGQLKGRNINLRPILKVKDISFSNKVHNVSFEVYPGEILGIAGLTGSGRTELLETIYGVNRLQKGSIYINEKKVLNVSPNKALRLGLMLIPDERQTKGLVMGHSVLYNIILPVLHKVKSIFFLNNKKSLDIVENLVKRLNIIVPSFYALVSNLSGGNQQKVVLSKAVARESQILLLDDPIVGIDVESKREIAKIIKEYVASGTNAAILVSSELDIIADICDKIIILRSGEVISEFKNNSENRITEEKLLALV